MRAMLAAMREEESSLRSNLGIFKIEQPVSKDLQNLEKVACGPDPRGPRGWAGKEPAASGPGRARQRRPHALSWGWTPCRAWGVASRGGCDLRVRLANGIEGFSPGLSRDGPLQREAEEGV